MSIIELSKLKGKLSHGDVNRISEKTGISKAVVSNHLSGKAKSLNVAIIDAAIDILEERKQKEDELKKRFADVLG